MATYVKETMQSLHQHQCQPLPELSYQQAQARHKNNNVVTAKELWYADGNVSLLLFGRRGWKIFIFSGGCYFQVGECTLAASNVMECVIL